MCLVFKRLATQRNAFIQYNQSERKMKTIQDDFNSLFFISLVQFIFIENWFPMYQYDNPPFHIKPHRMEILY